MTTNLIAIAWAITIIVLYVSVAVALGAFIRWARGRSGYYEKPPRPQKISVYCDGCGNEMTDIEYFHNVNLCFKCVQAIKKELTDHIENDIQ